MNGNRFYVHPAGDLTQGLQGLSQAIQSLGEKRKVQSEKERIEQMEQGAVEAYQSGDLDRMAEYAIQNPEISEIMMQRANIKSEQTKENLIRSMYSFLSDPTKENAERIVSGRQAFLRSQGQTDEDMPSTNGFLNKYNEDPENAIFSVKADLASWLDPEGWKTYQDTMSAEAEYESEDIEEYQFYKDLLKTDPDGAEQFAKKVGLTDDKARTSGETSYIPVGEDKYQYMIVDKNTGETSPVLKDGEPIVLTEKQVLIAEGKKAQSLINPYETKFMSKLGESEANRLTELKASATESRESLALIQEAKDQLNKGMYTGSAANIKRSLNKWLQEAGIYIGGRKAANTEAYASMMGLQVGKIIKQFGAGTGLSDADREYAEKIVGGRVTLTADAIKQLLDINERLAKFAIQEYNDQVERAKRNIEEKDYLTPVEIPDTNDDPLGLR